MVNTKDGFDNFSFVIFLKVAIFLAEPASEEEPTAESIPVSDAEPASEEEPAVESIPVSDAEPVAEHDPVSEVEPVVE